MFDHTSQARSTYTGLNEIAHFFQNLFRRLTDRSDLDVPIVDIDEEAKTVFLIWHCKASGFLSASDTFIFDDDLKISRQNVDKTTKV